MNPSGDVVPPSPPLEERGRGRRLITLSAILLSLITSLTVSATAQVGSPLRGDRKAALSAKAPYQTEASLELTDVFISATDGYHTYRIPAAVTTTNGTLLVFCEGRKQGAGDSGKIDLFCKRSIDNGRTWSPQRLLWSDGQNTCGNPTALLDRMTGTVWLFATWNLGSEREDQIAAGTAKDTRRVFVLHSTDDGHTWSSPVELTASVKKPNWYWYATGPGNGIQLQRGPHVGRLLLPANHSELDTDRHAVSRSHVFFSDDHGRTWTLGGSEEEKTNESTLVELADGTILQNMRSYHQKNLRAVATSRDACLTWSQLKFDSSLIEPVCHAAILRCTWPSDSEKSRIIFINPASKKREKLTARLSYDEATSWPISRILFSGPSAYSSATLLSDGTVACFFECGEKTPYEKIKLARFPVTWLETK